MNSNYLLFSDAKVGVLLINSFNFHSTIWISVQKALSLQPND